MGQGGRQQKGIAHLEASSQELLNRCGEERREALQGGGGLGLYRQKLLLSKHRIHSKASAPTFGPSGGHLMQDDRLCK